jgi:hypothetical protein
VETVVGIPAYNYTAMSATGNKLNLKSSHLELEPGTRTPSRKVCFTLTGISTFGAAEADLLALVELFESSRFSSNMSTGPVIQNPPSGIATALLSPNISQTFDNVAASMVERRRSLADEVVHGISLAVLCGCDPVPSSRHGRRSQRHATIGHEQYSGCGRCGKEDEGEASII